MSEHTHLQSGAWYAFDGAFNVGLQTDLKAANPVVKKHRSRKTCNKDTNKQKSLKETDDVDFNMGLNHELF